MKQLKAFKYRIYPTEEQAIEKAKEVLPTKAEQPPQPQGTKFKYFDEVPPPHEIKIIPKANDAYGKQGIKFINSVLNQISKSKKQQPR